MVLSAGNISFNISHCLICLLSIFIEGGNRNELSIHTCLLLPVSMTNQKQFNELLSNLFKIHSNQLLNIIKSEFSIANILVLIENFKIYKCHRKFDKLGKCLQLSEYVTPINAALLLLIQDRHTLDLRWLI